MYQLKPDTKLHDFQKDGVKSVLSKKTFAINDDMGAGKTIQALASIVQSKKKSLVICPPHLVQNWKFETSEHTLMDYRGYDHKNPQPFKSADIVIIAYTQLEYAEELFKWTEFIVLDESHYLKNMDSKRTTFFFKWFTKYKPEYLLPMSGTPIKNRIPEIYPFLLMLSRYDNVSPKITDKYDTLYKFCIRFTNIVQNKWGGFKCNGMKNVEELRTYVTPWMIRRDPSKYIDLPEMMEKRIVASYKDDERLNKEFSVFSQDGISANSTAKRESAVAKAKFTSDFVRGVIDQGAGPVVVFSDHVEPVMNIYTNLSDLKTAYIDQTVSMEKRARIVSSFQRGELDVLVCTIGTMSTGVTLTKANILVFNDISWIPADIDQARKRIHRIGQKEHCQIYYVVGSKVDDQIIKTLKAKSKVIKGVIDGEVSNAVKSRNESRNGEKISR